MLAPIFGSFSYCIEKNLQITFSEHGNNKIRAQAGCGIIHNNSGSSARTSTNCHFFDIPIDHKY